MAGEVRDVAVLYVDLVGSSQRQSRSPAEVAEVLNEFFEIVVAAVDDRQAINKFEGDAALARSSGAPLPSADPESDALATRSLLAARLRGLPMVDFGIRGVSRAGVRRQHRRRAPLRVHRHRRRGERGRAAGRPGQSPPQRALCSVAALLAAGASERAQWDRMRFGDPARPPGADADGGAPAGAFPPFPCASPVVGEWWNHTRSARCAPGGRHGRQGGTLGGGARTVSAVDSPAAIRNVVLVGPSGASRTTLVEALLVASGGVLSRAGSVEDGSTVCDFDRRPSANSVRSAWRWRPSRTRASRST